MLKKTLLLALLTVYSIALNAQIKKAQLLGEWQLSHFINKTISESEQKKRYIFLTDTLFYTSIQRNMKGNYQLTEQTGEIAWHPGNVANPIFFNIKYISADTLQLSQPTLNATIGVLIRKKQ